MAIVKGIMSKLGENNKTPHELEVLFILYMAVFFIAVGLVATLRQGLTASNLTMSEFLGFSASLIVFFFLLFRDVSRKSAEQGILFIMAVNMTLLVGASLNISNGYSGNWYLFLVPLIVELFMYAFVVIINGEKSLCALTVLYMFALVVTFAELITLTHALDAISYEYSISLEFSAFLAKWYLLTMFLGVLPCIVVFRESKWWIRLSIAMFMSLLLYLAFLQVLVPFQDMIDDGTFPFVQGFVINAGAVFAIQIFTKK